MIKDILSYLILLDFASMLLYGLVCVQGKLFKQISPGGIKKVDWSQIQFQQCFDWRSDVTWTTFQ